MRGWVLGLRGAAATWTRRWCPGAIDAWLYAGAAVFALVFGVRSWTPAEWHWGLIAFGPFVIGAVLSVMGRHFQGGTGALWRWSVLVLVFVGAVAVPLAYEVETRVAPNESMGLTEVTVIDAAGSYVAHLKDPYQAYVSGGRVINAEPGVPAFQSFFPYLPLLSLFGLPAALTGHAWGLGDARVAITLFTLLVLGLALALLRAPPERKFRLLQLMVILPTGALFLASGGDDMPILALCLLALVAFQRRNATALGVVLGIACAMKLTAWPVALALVAVSYCRDGRRTAQRTAMLSAGIVAITVIPYVLTGPKAFVANVFAFPLGLAGVHSPAATPLPGHVLTDAFPFLRHVLMPAILVVGGLILLGYLRRHWPITAPQALRVLAVAFTTVMLGATATRIGYIVYPIDFVAWSWVITQSTGDQSMASSWKNRNVQVVEPAEELVMVTPASQ